MNNSNDIETQLKMLGYQWVRKAWLKPVGYHLFTYEPERLEWTNWCVTADGKIGRYAVETWDSEKWENKFSLWIMELEADAKTYVHFGSFEVLQWGLV